MNKRFQIAGSALGLMMLASSGVGMAQESSPVAEGRMLFPAGCAVIAEGLNQPRYLTVAADGTVYVTEAGDGGEEVLSAPVSPETGTPVVGEGEGDEGPPITRGTSGQVTAIAPDGTQTIVASGLPSYGGVGPVGIVEDDGILTISVGGAAVDTSNFLGADIEELPYENALVLIDPSNGNIAPIAQLSHFEVDQNPDGTDINPNLYQLAVGP